MIEFKGPDKDIIRLTEMILKQNQDIIEMNKHLLRTLWTTVAFCDTDHRNEIPPSDASSYRSRDGWTILV